MNMKKWDNINYQKIKHVDFEKGALSVIFYNEDKIELPVQSILSIDKSKIQDLTLKYEEYEISFDLKGEKISVPWDKIRLLSDPDFAKDMAEKAVEHLKIVGKKLRILRELKNMEISQLAIKSELDESTISKIENGEIEASFATLRKILNSMDYTLKDLAQIEEPVHLQQGIFTWQSIQKRLSLVGVDNSLSNKIIPEEIRKQVKAANKALSNTLQLQIGQYFSRIFGWSDDALWANGPLTISSDPAQLAFFKTPSKGNIIQIRAYSHYAYYLANIVLKLEIKEPTIDYPESLEDFRDNFYKAYHQLTFQNLLQFTWDMGIRVIPLNDQGVFHGASWNIEGQHIIILKQRNESHARWIFDLLHELYHVFAHLENENSSIIETEEMNPFGNNNSEEEREANTFANKFIFGDESEMIARSIFKKADNKVEYLKNVIEPAAEEFKIGSDFIANLIAFRLQFNHINWWGTASNFQTVSPSPFELASSILKSETNIESLNTIDKNLLTSAINN